MTEMKNKDIIDDCSFRYTICKEGACAGLTVLKESCPLWNIVTRLGSISYKIEDVANNINEIDSTLYTNKG